MSRKPYEPCTKHKRTYCSDYECRREEHTTRSDEHFDNSGQVGITADGHLGIGIGGGMAIDTVDGGLDPLL